MSGTIEQRHGSGIGRLGGGAGHSAVLALRTRSPFGWATQADTPSLVFFSSSEHHSCRTGERECGATLLPAWEYGEHAPSIDQWKTAAAVTIATAFSEIHFQKMTGSVSWCDFILDFISMLKICR